MKFWSLVSPGVVLMVAGTAVAQPVVGGEPATPAPEQATTAPVATAPVTPADPPAGPAVPMSAADPASGTGFTDPAPVTTEPAPAVAEPASSAPKISGFVDTIYNYNFNRPADGKNSYYSYAGQHNNISLNAASVTVSGLVGDSLAYFVQVDAGADAVVDTYAYGVPTIFDIQEAYGQYTSKHKWGLKVGKFVTQHGIEVIESGANPTISRGFLFGLAEPFTHVGGMVTYQASSKLDFALGAINGWDLLNDNNKAKSLLAKVGINLGDDLALTISGTAGPDQPGNTDNWRTSFDVTGISKQGATTLNFQANVGSEQKVTADGKNDSWFGFGVQPVFKLSDTLSIGTRAEMFRNDKGSRCGAACAGAVLVNLAVAPALTLTSNLVLRFEARLDVSDKDAFVQHDGGATNRQVVALTEAIASF